MTLSLAKLHVGRDLPHDELVVPLDGLVHATSTSTNVVHVVPIKIDRVVQNPISVRPVGVGLVAQAHSAGRAVAQPK